MSDVNVRQNTRRTGVLADLHLVTEVCHVKTKMITKIEVIKKNIYLTKLDFFFY